MYISRIYISFIYISPIHITNIYVSMYKLLCVYALYISPLLKAEYEAVSHNSLRWSK